MVRGQWQRQIRRWAADRSGNFAMLTALCLPILAVAGGGAIDLGNAQRISSGIQEAADTASLAALRYTGTKEAERKAAADAIFLHNTASLGITVDKTSLAQNGKAYVYKAEYKVPTSFLRIISINQFEMKTEAAAAMSNSPLDVALVLDSSGSMALGGRMDELKKAVAMFLSKFETNGNTQIALIPFDTQVKADSSLFGALQNTTVQNPFGTASCSTIPDLRDRQACVENANKEPAPVDCSKLINATAMDRGYCSPNADGFRATSEEYHINLFGTSLRYRAVIEGGKFRVYRDTGFVYCTFYGCSWARTYSVTMIWEGPGGQTAPATSKPFGVETPNNDLLAMKPGPWPRCFIDRSEPYDTTADKMNMALPATIYPESTCGVGTLEPITGFTNNFTTVKAAANRLKPAGNTNVTIGVQWGMEAFTANAPMTGAQNEAGARRIMIVLSDGYNTQNRWYGPRDKALIDARSRLACANAKAMNIEIHTIRLIGGDESVLKPCASDNAFYHSVDAASELEETFAAIAIQVQGIRLVW